MISNRLSLEPKTMISRFDGLTQFSYRYNVSTPDDSFHKFVQATINDENIAGEYHHHVNPPNTLYLIKHKFHNYYKYVFKAKKKLYPRRRNINSFMLWYQKAKKKQAGCRVILIHHKAITNNVQPTRIK